MSDVINREPIIEEMKWFMKRGVPGRRLDFIVNGFITAFEKTCPSAAEDYIHLVFDGLRRHPIIRDPNELSLPRSVIAEKMEEILRPLDSVMKEVRGPVSIDESLSDQIRQAYAEFHGKTYDARAFCAARALVFKVIVGLHKCGPHP